MAKMTLNGFSNEITEQEALELEAAEKMAPLFDEDSPALTLDQLRQFKRINHQNRTKHCN
ncbi:MAG: hypothetical protein K6G60_06765 [Lachnospiraceae bacterium]|nr:hypothetical protein [Lachnospiraceae bacterium]